MCFLTLLFILGIINEKILCLLTLSLFVSQTSFAGAVNGEQTQSMIKGGENVGDDV